MHRFKKYLCEVWNPDELEDIDMSHSYTGSTHLATFPTDIDMHDRYQTLHDLTNAHVAAGGSYRDMDNETNNSPHVRQWRSYEENFRRMRDESERSHPDDETKRIKVMRHTYTYPTLNDIERIKKSAVGGMVKETQYDFDGQKMHPVEHVLENIHKFPGHHNGRMSFVEHEGKPTEVYISEHNRFRKDDDAKTTAASAMNAYKYAVSALRHYTSLPTQPWRSRISYSKQYPQAGVEPHKITDAPTGVHIFSGSTADARKDGLYRKILELLGHRFINTSGKPSLTSRQERIFRRTGRYA